MKKKLSSLLSNLRKSGSKFNISTYSRKTAIDYAESNGPKKIMQNLDEIQWDNPHDNL